MNLLLVPLIAWLYGPVLSRMFVVWMYNSNYSHGIFVPIFAGFFLWRDRKKLKSVEAAPSVGGLPLVGLALLIRHSALLHHQLFYSGVSLLLLLAGWVVQLYGWEFFRAVLFPWAFLILMIPVPGVIIQKFTFSFGVPTLKLSAFLLQLAGVPVVREGDLIVIRSATGLLGFESGIITLLTPLTLAIIHGYLADSRTWVRVVLACSSVPIAIVADSFRIVGTGLIFGSWGFDEAEQFSRNAGWLTFVVSLIMLFVLHHLITRIWGGSSETKCSVQMYSITPNRIGS